MAGFFALPLTVHAQGIPGDATSDAKEGGEAAGPLGAAVGGVVGSVTSGTTGLLGTDQRQRFREYAMREHRPSPYSFREPVTVGTVLPLTGITLYEIPREFGIPPEYRYAVVNNHVFLVDPVTHQIVDIVD